MTDVQMIEYTATRSSIFSMDATILNNSNGTAYGSIKTATFHSNGTVTYAAGVLAEKAAVETTYDVKKRKGTKGFIVLPSGVDDTVPPVGRAWRGGILTKAMNIALDGTLYYMVNDSFLKHSFTILKVADISTIPDIMDEEAVEQIFKDVAVNINVKDEAPVSYTHLTLPTILLV